MVQELGFDFVGSFYADIRTETQQDGDRVEVAHEIQAYLVDQDVHLRDQPRVQAMPMS